MSRASRNHIGALGLALFLIVVTSLASVADEERRHALSRVGAAAFPADFAHFDWVNPDAPKGGTLRMTEIGPFDSLNGFSFKGVYPANIALLHDSLMAQSLDEPATAYGLIAEWVSHPDDFSAATFGLRPEARFHDGRPISPEDVIFSFEEQKKAHPTTAIFYKDVAAVQQTGAREVTFRFAKPGNRDLPFLIGLLAIVPRHYWTAIGENGEPRDLGRSSLEKPLGSGPYRVKALDTGRWLTLERVKDYWAKDLPVRRGQYNFDEIHITFFRDDTPAFEAFKTGDFDVWPEGSSKNWATAYDFPAVRDGRVRKLEIALKTVAPMQGFLLNTRRSRFSDARVRRALTLAFDFETANKTLFYGAYKRLNSYFDNSELAQRGLPQGRELEILEPLRGQVPADVFSTEFITPGSGTAQELRRNLRQASQLLDDAGWKLQGSVRSNAAKEILSLELLLFEQAFERVAIHLKQSLDRLGVRCAIRLIDPVQYEKRVKDFDFDMIIDNTPATHAPGNEQREYWGSAAADKFASGNRAGIKNPAIDAIIEHLIYARDRAELIAATRALDRVLLWNFYLIPQWYNPTEWLAHWNRFGRPAKQPSQATAWQSTWWIDRDRDAKLGAFRR